MTCLFQEKTLKLLGYCDFSGLCNVITKFPELSPYMLKMESHFLYKNLKYSLNGEILILLL